MGSSWMLVRAVLGRNVLEVQTRVPHAPECRFPMRLDLFKGSVVLRAWVAMRLPGYQTGVTSPKTLIACRLPAS